MNRWLLLLALAAGFAAVIGGILLLLAWLARRHERRAGIGPDDGGRHSTGSTLDHLAVDQAADDAAHR